MIKSILCVAIVALSTSAHAEGCNISNLMFGKVRVEMIPKDTYQIGIIFGDDFDSARFKYDRILGRIDPPERDGTRKVSDVNQEACGRIESNLAIDTSDAECTSCSRAPIKLQRVGNGFAVMVGGNIMGTISGKLPK